jgi:hypothetical protein
VLAGERHERFQSGAGNVSAGKPLVLEVPDQRQAVAPGDALRPRALGGQALLLVVADAVESNRELAGLRWDVVSSPYNGLVVSSAARSGLTTWRAAFRCPRTRVSMGRMAASLLDQLDISPRCHCRLHYAQGEDGNLRLLPCRHVLAARDHGLSLEEWAELQRGLCPGDYADRPAPPRPALALSRGARVEVMRRRVAAGYAPWHAGDLWRTQPDDDDVRVGVEAVRERNGADADGALRGVL